MPARRWIPLFFAASACSWVPHAACHYYRLETRSEFVVGSWAFTRTDSAFAMAVYCLLIAANLWAVAAARPRAVVAAGSGALHLCFAGLHFYRLASPFAFRLFGYEWPLSASLRESLILSVFGLVSIAVAAKVRSTESLSQ
jgi:hypothetical protein